MKQRSEADEQNRQKGNQKGGRTGYRRRGWGTVTGVELWVRTTKTGEASAYFLWPDGTRTATRPFSNARLRNITNNQLQEVIDVAISRRTGGGPNSPAGAPIPKCPLQEQFPCVVEWIMEVNYSDGEVRQPGTISLFRGTDGTIRACITDKDDGQIAFMTGRTLTDLLVNLQLAMDEGCVDWRLPKQGRTKR